MSIMGQRVLRDFLHPTLFLNISLFYVKDDTVYMCHVFVASVLDETCFSSKMSTGFGSI